ncbi:hypothetical protein SK128_015782 [Halocaridina rubra]|uniref:Uncharacterized protein n=1 Tax=Halocaridina rubra TaxID=373956 RepID=A0AAN8X4I2_HALRR
MSSLTTTINLLFGLLKPLPHGIAIFSSLLSVYPLSLLSICPNHLGFASLTMSIISDPYNIPNAKGEPYNIPNAKGDPYNLLNVKGDPYNIPNAKGDPYNIPNAKGDPYNILNVKGDLYKIPEVSPENAELGNTSTEDKIKENLDYSKIRSRKSSSQKLHYCFRWIVDPISIS